MKIVYILIFLISVVKSNNKFTFLLNSGDISRTSLEFSANHPVYQIGLRCDNHNNDLWLSNNYSNLIVTPSQRQFYKCSDKNFTITLSNDFQDDYATIIVEDYNSSKKIQSFDFISDTQNYQNTALTVNKAITQGLYYVKNDFSLKISFPSTVYVEILKCPNSESQIDIKQFDINGLYRNLSGINNNTYFYDVFNTSNGTFNYRLTQSSYDSPDVFIKYQRVQIEKINDINSYTINYYLKPSATVKGDKIFISFPNFQVYNNEEVEYRITVGFQNSEQKELICGYGDSDIWRQYNSYYMNKYSLKYQKYSNNEIVADFPSYLQGNYNIRTTAIINFGGIQQTIPMQTISVYRNLYSPTGSLLIHILAPIIISVLALVGLIIGGCKYKKKKNIYLQQQQIQLIQQHNQIQNPYVGMQ
ncbi:unnamed protein product [Paramecium sonneborni]|uniref:Transmembrane protein n=1 Tax=Paramecium sonneborni TaxID=65129 RepID=A0A8S1QY08_9CILI|nr:unnamed protein product [Paramecium sonneborni]